MYELHLKDNSGRLWFNSDHGLTTEHPAHRFRSIQEAREKAFELMTPERFMFFIVDAETGESLQRV